MAEIKIKGDIVTLKSGLETSDANEDNFNESNINESIKALGDEFSPGDRSGAQTVDTNSDSPKN